MADDFSRAKDLYFWNKCVLSIIGVWPLQPSYIIFGLWMVYICIHLTMGYNDLLHVFGDLELMIMNLSETALESMVMVKLLLLRFSKSIANLMDQFIHGLEPESYDGTEEKQIYLNYNRIAKTFFKLTITCGSSTAIIYHLKPMEYRLRAVLNNESAPFVLPYRSRIFFEVNDATTFWLVYIYQTPTIYIHLFHTVAISYLVTLVLHVCAQLSILSLRIKNIKIDPLNEVRSTRLMFQEMVERHLKIIWMAKEIDDTFNLMLLEELVMTTVILGLTSYNVIVNSDMADKTVFISFCLYVSTMLMMVYGYCFAGEYLISESEKVYNAYYQCQWYDLSSSFKKQLSICMTGSAKPLLLTGGGFYVFSLAGFTSVLKSSMAYVSMLRTLV
nr:olfactory receptor 45 [Gregopimpla kuwanae]